MTPEELAEQYARENCSVGGIVRVLAERDFLAGYQAGQVDARQPLRDAVIEECAKVCAESGYLHGPLIAASILALKVKPSSELGDSHDQN